MTSHSRGRAQPPPKPTYSHSSPSKPQKATPPGSQSSQKRKAAAITHDDDSDDEVAAAAAQAALAGIETGPKAKKSRRKKGEDGKPEEKRLRRYRPKPPLSYNERLERVRSQRMFLIERERSVSEDGTHEEELFNIAGSTGNVYQVIISKVPTCSCPDAAKGNQCKHIIYVMVNILKARPDLAYQLALLITELTHIFTHAPVTQAPNSPSTSLSTDTGGTRKPIEGDCPVCAMEFEADEQILWCKASCGQNVHRVCFEQWQRSKPGVTKCVYCRSVWKAEVGDVKKVSKGGKVGEDGYVNVAGELGISTQRDMSSYHPYWVDRQLGEGRYGARW